MRIRVFKLNVGSFYVFRHLHCTRFGKLAVQVVCVWCIGRPPLPLILSFPFISLFLSYLLLLLLLLHSSRTNPHLHQICASFSRSSIVLLNFLTKYCCNNNLSIFLSSILVYFALEELNSDFKPQGDLVSFSCTKMILL